MYNCHDKIILRIKNLNSYTNNLLSKLKDKVEADF